MVRFRVVTVSTCAAADGSDARRSAIANRVETSCVRPESLASIDSASRAQLETQLPFGRLLYPTGYANANAALWLMAAWPALLLARSRRLAWPLRGVLAGSAVLLADVALLAQSRGSLYAKIGRAHV